MRAWLPRHPVAAAALVYAALSVLLYAPALLPGQTLSAADYLWTAAPWAAERPADVEPFGSNFELVDAVTQFEPWLEHTRERLPDVPLWNPHVGAGRPFLGNAQSAVLSPFSVPAYVLPFWWSLGVIAVLKTFCAAFGTFLLGRALGMRFGGALLAGLVYAFCLFVLVWIPWPHTSVWALFPWMLLLAELCVRRPGPLPAAGLAGVVALQFFGGHPESSFHLVGAAVVFALFRLVVLRREGRGPPLGAAAVATLGGFALGGVLAAVTLLPLLELLARSNDVDVRRTFWQIDLPREYLLGFALPEYWGRGTTTSIGAFAQGRAVYAGALPLVLAAAALLLRPTALRVGIAVFSALMLAVVVGLPPFPQIIQHIPVVKTANHLRLVVVVMLGIALLAGWGLDELAARRPRPRMRAVLLGLAGLALVLPVLVLARRGQLSPSLLPDALELAWGFADPPPGVASADTRETIQLSSLLLWLTFMGAAVVLLALRLGGRLAAGAFVALAVLLVAADLFRAGMGQTPAIAADDARQPDTPALGFLRAQNPARFVGLDRPIGPSPVPPNMALRWGLYDARSYDVPVERRYDRLWRRAVRDGRPTEFPTSNADLDARSLPAFSLLGVRHVVVDPGERPPAAARRLPVVYDRPDARILRNPAALPRAGVVDAQNVVPGGEDAQLAAVLAPGFDGRRTLVTDRPLPGLRPLPGPGPAGSARVVRLEPERVVVEATARRPGALVLADLHYPGWTATVDGEEADVHRVDYLLRATTLPAGRHTVEFRYAPLSYRIGWIVSLVGLVALAAVLALGLRARRRGPAA